MEKNGDQKDNNDYTGKEKWLLGEIRGHHEVSKWLLYS